MTSKAIKNYVANNTSGSGITVNGSTANGLLTFASTGNVDVESNVTYDGTNLNLTSSSLGAPDIVIESTADHAASGALIFKKNRASGPTQDNDVIGIIHFEGDSDPSGAQQTYAQIYANVEESGDGQEGGVIRLRVASHDGELQSGLIVEDGDAEDEVDVTIGNGANSVVTVPGNINIGGHSFNDIDVGSEHVDSDNHIMSSKAIKNYVASNAGGTGITMSGTPDYITLNGQEIVRNQIDLSTDTTGVPILNTGSPSAGQMLAFNTGVNMYMPTSISGIAFGIGGNFIPVGGGVTSGLSQSDIKIETDSTHVELEAQVFSNSNSFDIKTDGPNGSDGGSGGILSMYTHGFGGTLGSLNQSAFNLGNGWTSGEIKIGSGGARNQAATGVTRSGDVLIISGGVHQNDSNNSSIAESGDVVIDTGYATSNGTGTTVQGQLKLGTSTKEVVIGKSSATNTIKLQADVTQIGLDTPADGAVLTWSDSDGHTIWSTSSGGGATVNNPFDGAIVTSTGTSNGLDAESKLTYISSTLSIGESSNTPATIKRLSPSSGNDGGRLELFGANGVGVDRTGGSIRLAGGIGTGDGTSGSIEFYTHGSNTANAGGSANGTLNSSVTISPDGDVRISTTRGKFMGANMGNITKDYIYLSPADFHGSSNYRYPGTLYNDAGSMAAGIVSEFYYATYFIPEGYKATHVAISGDNQGDFCYVYSSDWNTNSVTDLRATSGNYTSNGTDSALDTELTGSPGKYIILKWDPKTITDRLRGARIKIVRV